MSITLQPAEAITFQLNVKEGEPSKRITIPRYYKEYYGCEVTRPRLPCVQASYRLQLIEALADPTSMGRNRLSRSNLSSCKNGTRFLRSSCLRIRLRSKLPAPRHAGRQLIRQDDQDISRIAKGSKCFDHQMEERARLRATRED